MDITIAIPAYNVANVIPKLIADARSQNPPFAEIIIYDDASKDNTLNVVRKLGVDKVIAGTVNRGASFARNRLIENCTSTWLHFHDADDRLAHNYTKIVQSHNLDEKQILICNTHHWDAVTDSYIPAPDVNYLDGCDNLDLLLNSHFPMGSCLYPTSLVKQVGGFDENLRAWEDYDYHIRMILAGARFKATPEVLNTYCHYGDTSYTEKHPKAVNLDAHRLFTYYATTFPKKHHQVIGNLLMQNAYRLFRDDNFEASTEAVRLAKSLGVETISSSYKWVRFLSQVVGPRNIFHIRRFRDILLGERQPITDRLVSRKNTTKNVNFTI